MLKKSSIMTKLLIAFFVVGIIPAIVISVTSLNNGGGALKKAEYSKLESIRETKKYQIIEEFNNYKTNLEFLKNVVGTYEQEGFKTLNLSTTLKKDKIYSFFDNINQELSLMSKNKDIIEVENTFRNIGIEESKKKWPSFSKKISSLITENSFDDIYFIEPKTETVIFDLGDEKQLGLKLKNKGLEEVYKKVLSSGDISYADFSKEDGYSCIYAGIPIKKDGKLSSIMVLKYSKDKINKIVQEYSGLGKTGETYLAGKTGDILSFRSDLKTMGDGAYVIGADLGVNTPEYWIEAFNGERIENVYTDSKGKLVMAVGEKLEIKGFQWIIITKMDIEEVLTQRVENRDIYDIYKDKFNFQDFFLIHPNGEVFYSVNKEKDYHTNIINGKFSKSGLGNLTKNILSTKTYEFEDFSIYEPKGNKVSAFIGIPYLNNNEIQFVIAAQISTDKINKIMSHISEMGKTGETILVGTDYLMRSDSNLDKKNRNVQNSFETKTTVETKDVSNALKGMSGTIEVADYMGKNVISSYTDIEVGKTKWALISKMNSSEVMTSNKYLTMWIIIILIVSITGIVIFALIFTKTISEPILRLNEWAKKVAKGESEIIDITDSKDEIGIVSESFRQVVESFQQLTEMCIHISLGDLTDKFTLRSENDQLGEAVNQMRNNFIEVVEQAKLISSGEYNSHIIPHSENDELSISLNEMTLNLKNAQTNNEKQNWIKIGQSEINDIMQGEQKIEELAGRIILQLSSYLSADVGTIFVKEKAKTYKMVGSYAFTRQAKHSETVREGQGLIGQVLIEKELKLIKDIPDDYMVNSSSIGEIRIKNILILPCIHNGEVRCVIELGKLEEFTVKEIELLKIVSDNIAISIESAEAQEQMKLLLDKTLKQSEELQQQQEELRQTNEELEEQARALRESEDRLLQQQEELRQTNEELEEQTKILRESEERLQVQQEELKVTNEELEERTFSLENQKKEINEKNEVLKKAQIEIEMKAKALEIASKYKSEFLANMSHELRTPLNSILILSQLLAENKNKSLSDSEIDYASTINTSGVDLLNLINDILDLSKVEAGKMEVNIEQINTKEYVNRVEKMFKHIVNEKGLKFEVDIDKDIPKNIFCDEQRLSQIIKNLMSNAIKFTNKGSITINVFKPKNIKFSTKDLENKELIGISVKDTGIGISEDKVKHIFEAFQQGDGTTSRKFGGTGLGLSISKEFIRLFGGEIGVKSEEGLGAEFTIILPVQSESIGRTEVEFNAMEYIESNFGAVTKNETLVNEEVRNETSLVDGKNVIIPELLEKTEELEGIDSEFYNKNYILIIEDDVKFSKILENMAESKGFNTIVTATGEKGLAIISKIKPIALILDIGLPGISGWEVLDKVRKNSKLKDIPVHIMSAIDSEEKFKELAISDFIQKPVSIERLEGAFNKIKLISKNDLKKILVVEDNKIQVKSIKSFILAHNNEVEIFSCETAEESMKMLQSDEFDCMILDLGLVDMSGIDLLSKIRKEDISQIPIIIYTGKDLTREENEKLEKYAETVILKGPESMERLLDETNLFLHHIEKKLKEKTYRIVKSEHEKVESLVGKKALVVDDDMRNVFALTSLLESKGIDVEPARNGREALDRIKNEEDFDVILMDIMMPEMDGYTAIRAIRKIKKYENIPIIALTAKAMVKDRNKCINAGANDYMSKPLEMEKLINLLKVWLY